MFPSKWTQLPCKNIAEKIVVQAVDGSLIRWAGINAQVKIKLFNAEGLNCSS
jgi:hypothetical protein